MGNWLEKDNIIYSKPHCSRLRHSVMDFPLQMFFSGTVFITKYTVLEQMKHMVKVRRMHFNKLGEKRHTYTHTC